VNVCHPFSGGCGSNSSTTMSRVAAWAVRAGLVIVHLLQQGPEVGEALAPEHGIEAEPVDQRGETARLAAIVDQPPFAPLVQQAGLLERPHMLGHRRLGNAGPPGPPGP